MSDYEKLSDKDKKALLARSYGAGEVQVGRITGVYPSMFGLDIPSHIKQLMEKSRG